MRRLPIALVFALGVLDGSARAEPITLGSSVAAQSAASLPGPSVARTAAESDDRGASYGSERSAIRTAASSAHALRPADGARREDAATGAAADCPGGTNLIVRGSFHYAPPGCSDGSLTIDTSIESTCSSGQRVESEGAASEALGCTDLPLAGARVELEQIGFGEPVAVVSTDADGEFLFCMINDPGNQVDVRAHVRTCGDQGAPFCSDAGPFPVVVTDVNDTIYTASTQVAQNVCTGTIEWLITDRRSPHNGAEAIFDLLANRAADVLAEEVEWPRDARLQARFPDTTTGFATGAAIVRVASGDEQDPSRVLGPYGIAVLQRLYGGTLPPTPSCTSPSWISSTSPGCAWVFGWADFLAASILGDPVLRDTPAPGQPATSTVNLEGPSPLAFGKEVRGAVAATLWDVTDDVGEPWDALSVGLSVVWDLVAGNRPASICEFRRAWRAELGPKPPFAAVLENHGIECEFGLDAIDPVRDQFSDLDRPRDLAASENVVAGLAADGATKVVLRYFAPTAGTVTFVVFDENSQSMNVGTLSSLTGSEAATTLTVPTIDVGREVAFAVLTAPADYARSTNDRDSPFRRMSVEATYETAGGTVVAERLSLDLLRPPVVLLHGWRGSADSWSSWNAGPSMGAFRLHNAPDFVVNVHEYGSLSQQPVDQIAVQTEVAIKDAVNLMRTRRIAATRADVVSHSLGGLMARYYVTRGNYLRADNFHAGDIHKLITLDTPHFGSPLADLLISRDGNLSQLGRWLDNSYKKSGKGICPSCGAVLDMRTDSALTRGLEETRVPAHALVGVGGRELVAQGERLAKALKWADRVIKLIGAQTAVKVVVKLLANAAGFLSDGINELQLRLFGTTEQHDVVVSETSQRGGLLPPAVSDPAFGFVPPKAIGIHTSVNHEARVRLRVVELLYAPVSDSAFAYGFPAAPAALETQSASLDPWPEVPDGIAIAQPLPGTQVTVGETISVRLQASSGFVPVKAFLLSAIGSALDETAPFKLEITVPPDTVGPVDLTAFAMDSGGNVSQSESVRIAVVNPAILTGLEVRPTSLHLFDEAPLRHLTVMGQFDDGVAREVGGADAGTTFATDDPEIATVSADGDVSAVGIGETTIHVHNGASTAAVPVVVESTPELSGCRPAPSADCESAKRALLKVSDADGDGGDQISWDFVSRTPLDLTGLGDPAVSRTYSLCIYDERSAQPQLVAALPIRPSPNWGIGPSGGLVYRDASAEQRGVRRVRMSRSVAGGTRIELLAKGPAVPIPKAASASQLFLQEPRVRVQLLNDETAKCWTTDFSTAVRNDPEGFRAKIQ